MRTIHRHLLGVQTEQRLKMPAGALLLSVADSYQAPGRLLDLWVLLDPAAPYGERLVRVFGTGHPVPDDPGRFVGAVVVELPDRGRLVWHVFDGGPVDVSGPDLYP